MSCFPQNKRNDDAIDLKMFNKICFQAAFAKRAKDKPAGSNQSKANTSNPGYLKCNRSIYELKTEYASISAII